jgi:hypothetical protein
MKIGGARDVDVLALANISGVRPPVLDHVTVSTGLFWWACRAL